MSVRAVGIDLVDVAGFAEQVSAPGSTFVDSTFTPGERRAGTGAAGAAQHLAGRFAAKEAFVKAFSSAIAGQAPVLGEVDWREIEVITDGWGRPMLRLHGAVAAAVLAALGPIVVHLSLSHEPTMAAAVVVIESADG